MTASPLAFHKMNGLGNEILVLDLRADKRRVSTENARALAEFEPFDQLMVLEPPHRKNTDAFVKIFNRDGSQSLACGNGTRCVAALVMAETGRNEAVLETQAGLLPTRRGEGNLITVDMGRPRFGWDEIPLTEKFNDTRAIELQIGPIDAPILHSPSVVSMGNPHAIFWVDDVEAYDLSQIGPMLENHPIFPERANISLAEIHSTDKIKLRVWERGAGLTRACGTAACAAAVAAARTKRTGRKVTLELPGGPLTVEWREGDDHVLMTGPWELEHDGILPEGLLDAPPQEKAPGS